MSKSVKITDLLNSAHPAGDAMVGKEAYTTCYDLAVYSLVITGELDKDVFNRWKRQVPTVFNHLVVDPLTDERIINPYKLPINSLIGFYRRFRPGEKSLVAVEQETGWRLNHMVRTRGDNSIKVLGGNNGSRNGTTPTWSENDIIKMFDWSGKELVSMWPTHDLPPKDSFSVGGKEQFVAFSAPISRIVPRIKRAYPWKFSF